MSFMPKLISPGFNTPGGMPIGPVEVDWSHPAAKHLRVAYIAGNKTELVSGNPFSSWTPNSRLEYLRGRQSLQQVSGTANAFGAQVVPFSIEKGFSEITAAAFPVGGDFSFRTMWGTDLPDGGGTYYFRRSGYPVGDPNNRSTLGRNGRHASSPPFASADVQAYFNTVNPIYVGGFSVDAQNDTYQYFDNGVLGEKAPIALNNWGYTAADKISRVTIGNCFSQSSVQSSSSFNVAAVLLFDAELSPQMMVSLTRDPYQIFRPKADPIRFSALQSGVVLSYLRPDADDATGNWVNESGTATLWPSIDETTASDSDFIRSGDNASADIARVRLSNPVLGVDTAQAVQVGYRYRKQGAATINLTVRLKEGTTTRASWVHSAISTAYVTQTQTLSAGEKSSITDWSNLFLEFEANEA